MRAKSQLSGGEGESVRIDNAVVQIVLPKLPRLEHDIRVVIW